VLFSWIETLKAYLDEHHPEAQVDHPINQSNIDSGESVEEVTRAFKATEVLHVRLNA
jgi:hypothetical protein